MPSSRPARSGFERKPHDEPRALPWVHQPTTIWSAEGATQRSCSPAPAPRIPSIPDIPFIEFHVVFAEQVSVFFLEGLRAVVLLLMIDVSD